MTVSTRCIDQASCYFIDMIPISRSYSTLYDPPQRSRLAKWRQRGSKSIYAKEDLDKRRLHARITITMKSKCLQTRPFQDEWKVANHADEKPCVNLAAFGEDLRGLITSQGYIGSSLLKRVSYQTCGRRIHLCHSDFNLGPSSCHYVAIQIFFCASWLSVLASFTAAAAAVW